MLSGAPGSQVKKIQQSLDINVQIVCDERLDKFNTEYKVATVIRNSVP